MLGPSVKPRGRRIAGLAATRAPAAVPAPVAPVVAQPATVPIEEPAEIIATIGGRRKVIPTS